MTEETPTVLLVDDERDLADLYAAWLADEYEIRTAYGGEEAYRSARSRSSSTSSTVGVSSVMKTSAEDSGRC